MNKRYQVFVSSTYADLKDERKSVIQTLMEMDCIPSGMELFPAMDEEQLEFIKKIIDDCDYYLLIIGGRYGSTTDEGISYTEKEFDYAVSKGLKVLAFLHGEPDSISAGKTDRKDKLAKKLLSFRAKAESSRLVKYWTNINELPGLVSLSLSKTIKTYPAVGWIRGDTAVSSAVLAEVNDLRKENAKLLAQLDLRKEHTTLNGEKIAGLDHRFKLKSTVSRNGFNHGEVVDFEISFKELFLNVAPFLESQPIEAMVRQKMSNFLKSKIDFSVFEIDIDEQDFQTIKIQFRVLNLVDAKLLPTTRGSISIFWNLTDFGYSTLLQLRAIRVN